MTRTPLFSIVTVCLNAGCALKGTAESVISQECNDYEYIVKDGGSKDGSTEFFATDQRYSRVRFVSESDSGIYSAMNQALEICTGKYVLFLNAGDTFSDNSVLAKLSAECSPEDSPGLVYTDYMTTELRATIKNPTKLTDMHLYRTTLCHQTCYIKRDCYEKLGYFNTDLKVAADYDFLLRSVVEARISYKHVPFVSVVYLSGGFSSVSFSMASNEMKTLRNKYFTGLTFLIYGMMYALTLPRLRIYVMRRPELHRVQKAYIRSVNFYYKIANFINNK